MNIRIIGALFLLVAVLFLERAVAAPQAADREPCSEEYRGPVAAGVQSKTIGTTAEPGLTDPLGVPAGRYALFPIQGIAVHSPVGGFLETEYYQTDANLNLNEGTTLKTEPWDPNYGYGPTQKFAAVGRILSADHDDVAIATRGCASIAQCSMNVSFLDQGYSAWLPRPIAARTRDSSDFIAIAQGDLDRVADEEGNNHNEVVVVHAEGAGAPNFKYALDVLNYNSGAVTSPAITSELFEEARTKFNVNPQDAIQDVLPSDNVLSVSIGDFDGDGKNEIAVAILADSATLVLRTYGYDTADNAHTLTLKSRQSWDLRQINPDGLQGSLQVVGTISSAAGDYDGDGADELAIGYAKWGLPATNKHGQYSVGGLVFKYDKSLTPTLANDRTTSLVGGLPDTRFAYDNRPIVHLVSGQFLMTPEAPGIKYGRRQFVLAWSDTGNSPQWNHEPDVIKFRLYQASSDLQSVTGVGSDAYTLSPAWTSYYGVREYSVTAGGFKGGAADGTLPAASLAVSAWSGDPLANSDDHGTAVSGFEVDTFATGLSGTGGFTPVSRKAYGVPNPVDYRAKLPLVAYDRTGRSVYLGAPVHITVHTAPKTDYVFQEPPKHAYWDEQKKDVQNLTRFDRNNVEFFNSSTDSLSDETTNTVDRSTGGSIYLTAGGTATAGKNFGIAQGSVEVRHDVGIGASYDYNEHKEQYNSEYRERTVSSHATTDRDDVLIGTLATYDVWRYRVFGTPHGEPLNYFYEIVMPGPEIKFTLGGQNIDWYQPIHENGNILSYPDGLGRESDKRIPFDLGTFTLPNGEERKEPLLEPVETAFDGTSGTYELRFLEEIVEAGSLTYNHTIGESYDSQTSLKSTAGTFGVSGEVRACGSIEFHNSNSWGGVKTSTDTAKTETGVILNRAPNRPDYAAPFFPVLYNTANGTLKMAFSMPNPASSTSNPAGFQTYANLYGGLPDPAVNLPFHFQPVFAGIGELEKWAANLDTNRKQMRGLFFRTAEKNEADGTYNFLSANPVQGAVVRIEPRIYNYSTAQTASDIQVRYQVIPYDSGTNSEICDAPINAAAGKNTGLLCPQSARTTIAETTIPELVPLQFTCIDGVDDPSVTGCAGSAFINWNTAGFGPPTGGTKEYRVYVVLNPERSGGDEIYPAETAPVPIVNVTHTSPVIVTAPGNHFAKGDYVYIGGVQGMNEANGIFQVTPVSADQFELAACEPAPPCAPPVAVNYQSYSGGGTATPLDPGQNNEGYRSIGITTPQSADSTQSNTAPQDYLTKNSLAALSETHPNSLQEAAINAYQGRPLELRLTAYSSALHTGIAHMLVYDGDPAGEGIAIADKFIHPGENAQSGASVWLTWTPATTGEHHLYAVLVEGPTSSHQAVELDVNVIARRLDSQR